MRHMQAASLSVSLLVSLCVAPQEEQEVKQLEKVSDAESDYRVPPNVL